MHGSRSTGLLTAGLAGCALALPSTRCARRLTASSGRSLVAGHGTRHRDADHGPGAGTSGCWSPWSSSVLRRRPAWSPGTDPVFVGGFRRGEHDRGRRRALVAHRLRGQPPRAALLVGLLPLAGRRSPLGAWAAGVVTAGTIGLSGANDLWRPMLWVAVTHMGAQAVAAPAVHAPVPAPASGCRSSRCVSHLALLALGAVACLAADPSQPVAFLLLPLLMWAVGPLPPVAGPTSSCSASALGHRGAHRRGAAVRSWTSRVRSPSPTSPPARRASWRSARSPRWRSRSR